MRAKTHFMITADSGPTSSSEVFKPPFTPDGGHVQLFPEEEVVDLGLF